MQPRPRIQIGISCKSLPLILPGTYAKFSVAHGGFLHEKHVTETEIQAQNAAPVFTTRLNLEYYFEEKQIITAEIFQCEREDREDSLLLGFVQCTVGRVIHSGGQLTLPLMPDTDNERLAGKIDTIRQTSVIVCIREDPFSKDNIYLKMQGSNLDKKDFFGKSDPYVTIYRRNERGKLQKCYRSEVIKNTLFPDFRPILIYLDRLCAGNVEGELCFRCYDWDGAVGDSEEVDTELDDLIGEFTTTVSELLKSDANGIEFELINPQKKKRKRYYQNSGVLSVRLFSAQAKYSFLDYIFGGTSINVVVGVDLSNHALNNQLTKSRQVEMAQSCNEYGVAIQAVMEILQEYDSDQLFPAFGFGSKLSSGGKLAHKYPLSGEANNYFCKGMAGVLEAYRRSFEGVHLAGPICFSPIVRDVSDTARRNKDAENYYVLLILTNGTVDDWIETKKAVIEASFLPVSIIVIGIGAGKFSDMEILDQDFGLLKVGQEQACRDNVQFVQMRRFLRMAADGSDNIRWSKVALAKEVLAELPSQMLDYFERNHLSPCHQIPGQPENLKDLVDPGWWRVFTQPLTGDETTAAGENVNQSSTTSSSETRESQAYLPDSDKRSIGEASSPSPSSSTYPQETRPVRLSTNNLANEDIPSSLESPTVQGARGGSSSNFSREASIPWPSNTGARQNAYGKPSLQDRHIRRQMSLGPTQHSSTERMNIAGRRTPNMTEQDLGRSSGTIK